MQRLEVSGAVRPIYGSLDVKRLRTSQCLQIQGDRRRKDNISGGDIIGHFEKKVYINICLILIGYRDKAV